METDNECSCSSSQGCECSHPAASKLNSAIAKRLLLVAVLIVAACLEIELPSEFFLLL